jgi:hypothetical protein
MSHRNREYESLYNVSLLDDLHNYFPELLYNHTQFSSVQDVLGYIQQNTQNQFNLYSMGMRDYNAQRTTARRSQQGAAPVQNRHTVRPHTVRTPLQQQATMPPVQQTVRPHPPVQQAVRPREDDRVVTPPRNSQRTANPTVYDDDPELTQQLEDLVTFMATQPRNPRGIGGTFSFLSNMLGGVGATFPVLAREPPLPQNFMEPVTVRPTHEQIEEASRVDVLAVASSDNCAICQDSFAAHSNRRTLVACNHAFHMNCIDTWFEQNVHCPVCRHDIRDSR